MPFPLSTRIFGSLPAAVVILAVGCAALIFELRGDEPSQTQVAYPAGYRQWVHVKSGVMGAEFPMETERGIHHVYANPAALAGFESGTFEDGSVVVYDLVSLSDKETRSYTTTDPSSKVPLSKPANAAGLAYTW